MNGLFIECIEDNEILWRLDAGSGVLDGACKVRDGRVETPDLYDEFNIELRPCAIREIRKACQEWYDDREKQ
jgi:hypothetical protein